MGPLTIMRGPTKYVVASTPWRLNASVHEASTAARTTGRYDGLQPAMTALIATFSTVAGARFGGTNATTSVAEREVCSSMRSTRPSVGGTTGSPSVRPSRSRNSNGSRSSGTRTRRDPSWDKPCLTASRRAMSGSWIRDPQPGRSSGSVVKSESRVGAIRSHCVAASATRLFRSLFEKPSKLASTLWFKFASTSAGTASNP